MSERRNELIDKAIEQIEKDVSAGDWSAIYELLTFVDPKYLENFLEEENADA